MFTEREISCIEDFSYANYYKKAQVEFIIKGPKESPYADGYISVMMNIPEAYPDKPPTVFVGCRTYHVNINQEDN